MNCTSWIHCAPIPADWVTPMTHPPNKRTSNLLGSPLHSPRTKNLPTPWSGRIESSEPRVLHMVNPRPLPGPIMPVDMAMRICLAHSPPLRNFLSSYKDCHSHSDTTSSLRPCISIRAGAAAPTPDPPSSPRMGWASRSAAEPRAGTKKKVVFADSKGMSLTAIHVFKEFEDDPLAGLQFDLADLKLSESTERGLVLDFPQPAGDYLDFRNRLKQNQVCLENCAVQERTVAGTVKVRNVCFEKTVSIRVTLDAWKSHRDVECSYMNNVYGCPDTDTFAFSLDLPDSVATSQEQVEFCIRYQTREHTYWDNNNGSNYRLLSSDTGEEQSGSIGSSMGSSSTPAIPTPSPQEFKREVKQMEFDQFGSPRTSSGFFPEWQSWGRLDNTNIYW